MTYYLQFGIDSDPIIMGEQSFDVFWADQGFDILKQVVDHGDTMELNIIHIKNDQNEDLTINEFLDKIEKLQVRTQ
jgi:hypoxanthine-guanine phosphoribosyltransferase